MLSPQKQSTNALNAVIERTFADFSETYDFCRSLGGSPDGIVAENSDAGILVIFRSFDHLCSSLPTRGRHEPARSEKQ